jgi:hypothetical protein
VSVALQERVTLARCNGALSDGHLVSDLGEGVDRRYGEKICEGM